MTRAPAANLRRTQQTLDRVAVGMSVLCLVHCLATPLLIVLAPVLAGTLLGGESFHLLLLFGVLPTSMVALWIGCRHHRDRRVLMLGILGLFILVAAALWGSRLLGEAGEKGATMAGSLAIVAGHWRNYRLCRGAACVT